MRGRSERAGAYAAVFPLSPLLLLSLLALALPPSFLPSPLPVVAETSADTDREILVCAFLNERLPHFFPPLLSARASPILLY